MPPHRMIVSLWAAACALGIVAPTLAQGGSQRADPAQLASRLMEADANRDGLVTRAELATYRNAQFARIDRNADGISTLDEIPAMFRSRFEPMYRQLLSEFDANHDGRIARTEFVQGPTRGFDLADANHDGIVTRAEVDALAQRALAARRG